MGKGDRYRPWVGWAAVLMRLVRCGGWDDSCEMRLGTVGRMNMGRSTQLRCKRFADVLVSGLGLAVLAPIYVVIACAVRYKLGAPVLFHQVRSGKGGHPFRMTKFRSMRPSVSENGEVMSDAERLTDFGRTLRRTSLDELPELWNVLRGDMSLVGPRPLLVEYLPFYSPEQMRRHEMSPGITGWAQVNGRNTLSWEEKFALDVWYVDNWSLWLDVKILVMTVIRVLQRQGISGGDVETMTRFDLPEGAE